MKGPDGSDMKRPKHVVLSDTISLLRHMKDRVREQHTAMMTLPPALLLLIQYWHAKCAIKIISHSSFSQHAWLAANLFCDWFKPKQYLSSALSHNAITGLKNASLALCPLATPHCFWTPALKGRPYGCPYGTDRALNSNVCTVPSTGCS
jgi:hypothetical protein